ncbi:hypothetical protein ACR9YC_06050 [Parasphingorhabdus sp. DH2-15]|uniref:hypothetical protein n=1 Tax=Parasphingorhabdus sp. DH2-15 TaxID=3444112 RepID=UPI003F687BAA
MFIAANVVYVTGALSASAYEPSRIIGTIERPADKDWGDLYLVEIELPKARPHPSEYYCPSDMDENSICLGASIIYRQGKILRVLAATKESPSLRKKVRVKGIGGHAVRYGPAKYAVVLLERTDDGYYWMPIEATINRGKFCLSDQAIDYFNISLKLRPRASEDWESCFRI